MKIPSATGLVFASLALSGSTLAAPTGNPSSPNPNSPRDLDFPPSPDVHSPRALNQAFFQRRVRRGLPRSRNVSEGASEPCMKGLGLMTPDAKPAAAAPMQRSLAQLSTRDDGTVNAEGLGLIDQPTSDQIKGAVHGIALAIKPLPVIGDPVSGIVDVVGNTVGDLLGPAPKTPPTRRTTPHWMRRQSGTADATPPADGTVSAEGLGLVPAATGKQISDALHAVGDTLGSTIPIVGPTVGGLIGTVGDLLGSLISRDLADVDMDAHLHPQRRTPQGLSAYQQLPPGLFPEGLQSMGGQTTSEIVGPDGRVYQVIGQLPEGESAASTVGDALSDPTRLPASLTKPMGSYLPMNAASSEEGATEFVPGIGEVSLGSLVQSTTQGGPAGIIGYLSNGLPIFDAASAEAQGALGQAQGALGTVSQSASGLGQTAAGAASNTPAGAIFKGATNGGGPLGSIQGIASGLPDVGGTVGGALGTAQGLASGLPVLGGTVSGALGTAQGIVGGLSTNGALGTVQGFAGNLPVLGGLLGSLPLGSQSSGGFGILSAPDATSASSNSMPSATGSNSMAPTSTGLASSTATTDLTTTTAAATPTATGGTAAAEDDGADSVDDSSSDADGSDDEGKDPTDDNDVSSSASVLPSTTDSSTPDATSTPSQRRR